jgi:hypothetical protein
MGSITASAFQCAAETALPRVKPVAFTKWLRD